MKQHSIEIAEFIRQNGLKGTNPGLMHGTIGICIFYYCLAQRINNPDYEKIADDLLDKVFANMNTSTLPHFENGLAGIGWGIEYLVQNNFAEGNTDEILEEIDNVVFKTLYEETPYSFELSNGLTGYLFYLINRLKNKKVPFSMSQRINMELFIQTINKIDELATAQFPTIVKEMHFDLLWRFPIMLLGLIEAFKLNIYNEKITYMFNQWVLNFESYIPSLHINKLFFAIVFKKINSIIPNNPLENQMKLLLFGTDFEKIKAEVDHNVLNIRYGWPGVALLLNIAMKELPVNMPNYHLIGQTFNAIMGSHENQLKNLTLNIPDENYNQFGIALGLSGVGLMDLLFPGILSCNCLHNPN